MGKLRLRKRRAGGGSDDRRAGFRLCVSKVSADSKQHLLKAGAASASASPRACINK